MVMSCGADASVVAFWVGWIKTSTSALVVSLGGIVSWAETLSWSYELWWFKEVRNGVRDFVCVIFGCAGLSSLDAWLWGSVGIFATSIGFTMCFRKPFRSQRPFLQRKGIFAAQFAAQRWFRSQWAFSQLWNCGVRLRNGTRVPKTCFAATKIFAGGSYGAAKSFRSGGPFSQPTFDFAADTLWL